MWRWRDGVMCGGLGVSREDTDGAESTEKKVWPFHRLPPTQDFRFSGVRYPRGV